MNENVEINISSNIDTKGLDQLRKALNDQRNELNAVARETDKADIKYKQLKAISFISTAVVPADGATGA